MTQQRRPLFGGLIQPITITTPAFTDNPIFTPPDATAKAPITYEVHLWAMANSADQGLGVVARDNGSGKESLAWAGVSKVSTGYVPVKVLDGYPVRGNISLVLRALGANAAPIGESLQTYPLMWGFFYAVGGGHVREDERRFVGQTLNNFNKGLGFNLSTQPSILPAAANPAPQDSIIHTFESGRIDEMSIGFAPYINNYALEGTYVALSFEKADNSVLSLAVFAAKAFYEPGAPPQGAYPASSYLIHKVPFGGGGAQPLLHHIRAAVVFSLRPDIDPVAAASVHGYFVRK